MDSLSKADAYFSIDQKIKNLKSPPKKKGARLRGIKQIDIKKIKNG